jgi:hypothetical protein
MKVVLAYGGGVNSTAIIALKAMHKLPIDFDTLIHAKTMFENPKTDRYIEEVIKPYCWMERINFVTVQSPLGSLYSHYMKHHIIPTRMFRHCTDNFKIKPMRKWCERQYPDGYIMILGIDAGEAHRAKTADYFPLIDMGIDREGCIRLIKQAGLPVPVKSGCLCCPFTPPKDFKKMSNDDPESFKKVVALEKNGSRYPEITISTKPLEVLAYKEPENGKLCDWLDKCAYCE